MANFLCELPASPAPTVTLQVQAHATELVLACAAKRARLKSTASPDSPITYNATGDSDWVSGALIDIQAVNAAKVSKSSWISGCDNITGGC